MYEAVQYLFSSRHDVCEDFIVSYYFMIYFYSLGLLGGFLNLQPLLNQITDGGPNVGPASSVFRGSGRKTADGILIYRKALRERREDIQFLSLPSFPVIAASHQYAYGMGLLLLTTHSTGSELAQHEPALVQYIAECGVKQKKRTYLSDKEICRWRYLKLLLVRHL